MIFIEYYSTMSVLFWFLFISDMRYVWETFSYLFMSTSFVFTQFLCSHNWMKNGDDLVSMQNIMCSCGVCVPCVCVCIMKFGWNIQNVFIWLYIRSKYYLLYIEFEDVVGEMYRAAKWKRTWNLDDVLVPEQQV